MRCLLVTKEFSANPTSGGTLRTLALLEQLAGTYATTVVSPDAVLTKGPGEELVEQFRRSGPADRCGTCGRCLGTSRSVASGPPGPGCWTTCSAGVGHYDVAILDHTCLAGLADDVATGCDELVVSMHNIESDLMAQRASGAGSAQARVPCRPRSGCCAGWRRRSPLATR